MVCKKRFRVEKVIHPLCSRGSSITIAIIHRASCRKCIYQSIRSQSACTVRNRRILNQQCKSTANGWHKEMIWAKRIWDRVAITGVSWSDYMLAVIPYVFALHLEKRREAATTERRNGNRGMPKRDEKNLVSTVEWLVRGGAARLN